MSRNSQNQQDGSLITGAGLEVLHAVLHVFLKDSNLFTKPTTMSHSHTGLFQSRSGIKLRKEELLFKIKDKLGAFLTEAFTACAEQRLGSKIRMCDLAAILLQLIQPWKNKSNFFEALENLDFLMNAEAVDVDLLN